MELPRGHAGEMRCTTKAKHRSHLAAVSAVVAALFARPAAADFNVVTGGSVTYDSNIFRLSSSADPQTALGRTSKADVTKLFYAGIKYDKQYSLQRLQLDVTQSWSRHVDFPRLDFDSLEYRANWQWYVTPKLSGTVHADRSKALVSFEDFSGTQRITRINETRRFSLDANPVGGWHALGGVSEKVQSSSQRVLASLDYRLAGPELGVKYETRAGGFLMYTHRSRDGDYLNRDLDPVALLDNRFVETEDEL